MNRPISPIILTLKLVAWQRLLIDHNRGSDQYGENLVKIGPVDPEIIYLKCLFEKKIKKINANRTYSPRGRHAARGKSRQVGFLLAQCIVISIRHEG